MTQTELNTLRELSESMRKKAALLHAHAVGGSPVQAENIRKAVEWDAEDLEAVIRKFELNVEGNPS